ncbi:MAG TPA: hypothetical protein PKY12_11100 [Catalimonadaceae bacterium]|nr:hypothetical protein [Catalimonadaceae bacterium]
MKFCHVSGADLDLKIYSSIKEIGGDWDSRLPPNHSLQSKNWLVLEQSDLPLFEFWYVQIFEKGVWIGQAAFQIVEIKNKSFNFSGLEKTIRGLVCALLKTSKVQVLVCGNLLRQNQIGFYFKEARFNPKIFSVVKKLTHWRKGIASPVVSLIKDYPNNSEELIASKAAGFKPLDEDTTMTMCLDPQWTSLEDYSKSLTKKYAQRFQKIRLAGQSVVKRPMDENDLTLYSESIEKLYSDLVNRQNFRPFSVNSGYFLNMKKELGKDFEVMGYFSGNDLVAFSSYHYYDSDAMEIHYIGFDVVENENKMLYFNILFDGLEKAISKKMSSLFLGRGSFDAKSSLGAEVKENHHYIWLKPGIYVFLFQIILQYYQKSEGKIRIVRNPFRKVEKPELLTAEPSF